MCVFGDLYTNDPSNFSQIFSLSLVSSNHIKTYFATFINFFFLNKRQQWRTQVCINDRNNLIQNIEFPNWILTAFEVTIKNAGKTYDIELQEEDNGQTLKSKIQQLTLIPPERQKF